MRAYPLALLLTTLVVSRSATFAPAAAVPAAPAPPGPSTPPGVSSPTSTSPPAAADRSSEPKSSAADSNNPETRPDPGTVDPTRSGPDPFTPLPLAAIPAENAIRAPVLSGKIGADGTERIDLPSSTVYTDALPAGVVRTDRTVRTEIRDGHIVITTLITHYRRAYRPIEETWLVIPAIGLRRPLVEGVTQRAMSHDPGHFPGMALPGEIGNCGIAAHSNVPGCDYFRYLHRLRPGDRIYLETEKDTFAYVVANTHVVRPSNSEDLLPSSDRRLTLVTCTLPDARNRLVVVATGSSPIDRDLAGETVTRYQMPQAGRRVYRARRRARR